LLRDKKDRIGIVGAGTMGNGIAHVFALNNYDVVLVDLNTDILDKALSTIKNNMLRQVKKTIVTDVEMINALDRITTSNDIKNLKHCNIVIEAIKEDLDIKSNLFKSLDSICKKDTIFASNTSSISIDKLASRTERKDKVVGMHFMNPVPVMKLIELIKGDYTSNKTVNYVVKISKDINKIPVQCNDSPGFVSNRILMPMINEAAHCYSEGVASVESIDSIMKLGMGHPMGPLMLADLIGIDVCVYILEILYNDFSNDKYKPCEIFKKMVINKELGKKTGKGFYNYEF
jgi:3-hydroxybutyryl-CoA dehydrogenase